MAAGEIEILTVRESEVAHSREITPVEPNAPDELQIIIELDETADPYNFEDGGSDTVGTTFELNDGGQDDALESYNTIQDGN